MPPVSPRSPRVSALAAGSGPRAWIGLLPPIALGTVAWFVGSRMPLLGAPVIAILLGLVAGEILGQPTGLAKGTTFCAKRVLQASIVLLGATLSLGVIAEIGGAGLPVMLGTLVLAIAGGIVIGRWLGIERETRTLVTYGTAICGASAIATMSQVIGAAPTAMALSIAVIVVYNVLAAVAFPFLGQLMHLTPESFGLWAGTAVNDTSSVLAAATSYDHMLVAAGVAGGSATAYAVVVKLTRTLAIIPLAIGQSWWLDRRQADRTHAGTTWWRLVPGFLVLFLLAATARTVGLIPITWLPAINDLARYGTTVAMAAVGMLSSLTAIRRAGWRPLLLGAMLWVLVAVSSLALQLATGQLHTY